MYTNLITNYTVFKSLLEADPRRMTELAEEHRELVKPKFIKEIKEEGVERTGTFLTWRSGRSSWRK